MNSLASFLWLLSLYAKQQKCQVIWKKVYFYRPAQSCSPVRWETSVKQKRLCRSGIVRPTSPGCGSQRLFRPLGGPHILLAAAPTAPPCFRRWRRSSPLLLPRGGLGIPESFASSPEAPLLGELAGASPTERLDEGRPGRIAFAGLNLSVTPAACHLPYRGEALAVPAK